MSLHQSIRDLNENKIFGKGDVLVLFGELFQRGYANGLVDEARRRGMVIINSTVGRRDASGMLVALDANDAAKKSAPFINIPLEAGFDLEPCGPAAQTSIVDLLKDVRLTNWQEVQITPDQIHFAKKNGQTRFLKQLEKYFFELEKHIPENANVLFAHLMAGGVPRAKIVLPLMNRVFKGTGDRHLESQTFWESSIGKFCAESFLEVTAETFNQLVTASEKIRNDQIKKGKKVSYLAYGYHGTEVLIDQKYTWQTYTPYLQGWAKMRLEQYAQEWSKKSIECCVYNCPEILTNSSSIFQGVEISLYPLLQAFLNQPKLSKSAEKLLEECQKRLKPDITFQQLLQYTNTYLSSELNRSFCDYKNWPRHNSAKQMEAMLDASDFLFDLHLNPKEQILPLLSEAVFQVTGKVMLNDIAAPKNAVSWIHHDIVAKAY